MADYRLSATAISRGKGQSSVASAAYRSGAKLVDERTGEIHDYTRKAGVIHSEVLTPEGTPEWMQDRAQLWNAVEAIETRKNSQLAREIQLSLPHELEPEQRLALVRGFVQEQFVNQGMIADVALHAPSAAGDERNHHAHIMLTMRELTGEGFHSKKATPTARSWNSDETLLHWREQWANHQNRALERNGHKARVDHRSYEAQGIDREPSQHLGPVASDMERNGKASRIGDENRETANDNSARALDQMALAQIAREKWKFGQWAEYKRAEISNAQDLADLDLSQKHHRQKLRLEDQLKRDNGTVKATLTAEVQAIDRRLQAGGVRKVLRDVFGRTKTDSTTRAQLQATLAGIEKRENEQRQHLERSQKLDRKKESRRQKTNRERLETGIQTARERREARKWTPRQTASKKRAEARPPRKPRVKPKATPSASQSFPEPQTGRQPFKTHVPADTPSPEKMKPTFKGKAPPAETKPSDALDDATKKTTSETKLDRHKGDAKRPWQGNAVKSDNKRPWESNLFKKGKSPAPDRGKK